MHIKILMPVAKSSSKKDEITRIPPTMQEEPFLHTQQHQLIWLFFISFWGHQMFFSFPLSTQLHLWLTLPFNSPLEIATPRKNSILLQLICAGSLSVPRTGVEFINLSFGCGSARKGSFLRGTARQSLRRKKWWGVRVGNFHEFIKKYCKSINKYCPQTSK